MVYEREVYVVLEEVRPNFYHKAHQSQTLKCFELKLSLPNPLKPCVKLRMKV